MCNNHVKTPIYWQKLKFFIGISLTLVDYNKRLQKYALLVQRQTDTEKYLEKCHLKRSPCKKQIIWKFKLLCCKIMQMADSARITRYKTRDIYFIITVTHRLLTLIQHGEWGLIKLNKKLIIYVSNNSNYENFFQLTKVFNTFLVPTS